MSLLSTGWDKEERAFLQQLQEVSMRFLKSSTASLSKRWVFFLNIHYYSVNAKLHT